MDTTDRQDPYTLVFGAESMDERLFPPIAEEAEARDLPLEDPDRFLFLSSVGKLLQAIAGPDPYESGGGDDEARKEALRQYGRLLYHAFHFWRDRKTRVELTEEKLRWLIEEVTTVGDWRLRPPAAAGYLRLPRNLVWAAPAPNLTPEAADGFFWVFTEPEDEPPRLHVLLTLGVRPDRAGFSVVPATGVLDDEPHWAEAAGRPEGADFETTLPGGELDTLYSIETAARALDGVQDDLASALRSGELAHVPGLGPATLGVVRQLVETGRSRLYDRLRAETPAGMVRLRAVAGLGPKRVRTLHEKLGIETLDALREAAESGQVAALPGFGPATQRRILEGIAFVDESAGRRRQPQAYATADRLATHLEGLGVERVWLTGELRRRCETAGALDLLVVTDDPDRVLDAFLGIPALTGAAREPGGRARAAMADGAAVRLRCVEPAAAAAARVVETGSDGHVAALRDRASSRGLRLEPDGLWRGQERLDLADEAALYGALELEWVPPELREGRGEVAAAAAGRLPRLVHHDDLRGTFHCHTTWSDGRASVAEMAEGARARGWRYLGIADHSVSASYAGGLTVEELRAQHREIDAWNESRGGEVRVLKGVEADILGDGRLDYDDAVLADLDYVVGSVHSGFRMERDAMTRRIATAVANPRLTILGHPTGRLLLSREPYAVDLDAVIGAAAEAGAAIEINADPHRLDMDWRHWPGAKDRGVRCAINPDAHSVAGLGAVRYGIGIARKGGLEPEDVINTWELERVESYLGAP